MTKNNTKEKKMILLGHGSGGKLTHELIDDIFLKCFKNKTLAELQDSARINLGSEQLAFTTDSYVVNPFEFPGGDIGKLAVCGTVNDLAVCGASPLFLSCGFIIEEGFDMNVLSKIASSMATTAKDAGVKIVTGDTKVVEKGSCDKIFINTAGIGTVSQEKRLGYKYIKPGDQIIINGNIGDHGFAILAAREGLEIESQISSDCANLNLVIDEVYKGLNDPSDIRFMRDATRGGVATTLCEVAESTSNNITIYEEKLPIAENTNAIAEILGIDPLFSANEGKVLIIASKRSAKKIIDIMKANKLGKNAAVIGEVTSEKDSNLLLETSVGTKRRLTMLTGHQLPRIC